MARHRTFNTLAALWHVCDHVRIDTQAHHVLTVLIRHASAQGIAWASKRTISAITGWSPRTVTYALHTLEREQLIREHAPATQHYPTQYDVLPYVRSVRGACGAPEDIPLSSGACGAPLEEIPGGYVMPWEEEQHTNPGHCRDCGHYYAARPHDDLCAKCAGKRIEQEQEQPPQRVN